MFHINHKFYRQFVVHDRKKKVQHGIKSIKGVWSVANHRIHLINLQTNKKKILFASSLAHLSSQHKTKNPIRIVRASNAYGNKHHFCTMNNVWIEAVLHSALQMLHEYWTDCDLSFISCFSVKFLSHMKNISEVKYSLFMKSIKFPNGFMNIWASFNIAFHCPLVLCLEKGLHVSTAEHLSRI